LKYNGHINHTVGYYGLLTYWYIVPWCFSIVILPFRKAYKLTVYIRPILLYASSVWSSYFIKYINSIENVQGHFTKE